MRKLLLCLLMLGLGLFSTPVGASLLVTDLDPDRFQNNHLGAFWIGDDFNTGFADNLINASESTETGWLEVGLLNNTEAITYYDRWNAPYGSILGPDDKVISIDTSAFLDWEYAIVKWDGRWAAYYDNDGSNILTHPVGFSIDDVTGNGVSHITWFNAQPVPEPATMLLLGSGLIGLAGFGRKKLLK